MMVVVARAPRPGHGLHLLATGGVFMMAMMALARALIMQGWAEPGVVVRTGTLRRVRYDTFKSRQLRSSAPAPAPARTDR
jgi:hypothetical protein